MNVLRKELTNIIYSYLPKCECGNLGVLKISNPTYIWCLPCYNMDIHLKYKYLNRYRKTFNKFELSFIRKYNLQRI